MFKDAYSISLKKGNVSSDQGCLQHFNREKKCLQTSRMLIPFYWRKEMPPEFKDAYIISLEKGNVSRPMMLASFHWRKDMAQDLKDACIIALEKEIPQGFKDACIIALEKEIPQGFKDACIIALEKGNASTSRMLASFHWRKEMSKDFKDACIIALEKGNASRLQGCLQHFIGEGNVSRLQGCLHHFIGERKCLKTSRMLTSFYWRKEMSQDFKDACSILSEKFKYANIIHQREEMPQAFNDTYIISLE